MAANMYQESDLVASLKAQTHAALWECCPPAFIKKVICLNSFTALHHLMLEDAVAFAEKDPAANKNVLLITQTYSSFKVLLHYRLAHYISKNFDDDLSIFYASMISNRGKSLSGADIHFKSQIGKRFVLDHGYGTVIGETAIIGHDCYFLGGITLGSKGIANNHSERRHPRVGNFVEIGACTRIFGDVSIGDYSFIGPFCVICKDVDFGSRIIVTTTHQVEKNHDVRNL